MLQKILEIMFSHGRWMMILQGLGTTLLIALCAVLMGTILGCIFAIRQIKEMILAKKSAGQYEKKNFSLFSKLFFGLMSTSYHKMGSL